MYRGKLPWPVVVIATALFALPAHPELPQDPSQEALASGWQDLANENGEIAYRAVLQLARDPDPAVKLLAGHLKPAEAPDLKRIQAWINDLADASFAVRQKATQELKALEELAAESLRQSLKTTPDLETRRRVEGLLRAAEQSIASPEKLRQIRAVEVLEMVGTPQAAEVLQRLAKGYPSHRQTREAQESLARLKQRDPVPERWLTWIKAAPRVDKEEPLPPGARVRLGSTFFRNEGQGRIGPGRPSTGTQSAFSPDSRWVISQDGNAVYLRERESGKVQRKFDLAVNCLVLSPTGTLMALGLSSKDQRNAAVVCWDWQAGKELHRLELPPGTNPLSVAFSLNAGKILYQSTDDHLREWDFKSGQQTTLWQPDGALNKLHGFSADGNVAVVSAKMDCFVVDLRKPTVKRALPALSREARLVTFSPDAKYVALTADYPGEALYLCETATGKIRWRTSEKVVTRANSVGFSADGKKLIVGSSQQEIQVWDVETGKFLRSLIGSNNHVIGGVSSDGRWLASTGQTMRIWDLQTGQRNQADDGHLTIMNGLTFSPRCDWIATFDYKEVHLWDPVTGKHLRLVDTDGTFVRGVAVSPDGTLMAAAHPGPRESWVKVWDIATGRVLYQLPGHGLRESGRDAAVHFSRDGRFLQSWGDDGHLRKWDMKTWRALLESTTHTPNSGKRDDFLLRQRSHGWNEQGDRFLLLDGSSGDLHTFDTNTGKQGPVVKLGAQPVGAQSAFSSTAKLVCSFGFRRDMTLTVHDTTTGNVVFNTVLAEQSRKVAFSADERTLAAVVGDRVLLIELATGKTRFAFDGRANALAFSPDGRCLATANGDTTALVWDLALLTKSSEK